MQIPLEDSLLEKLKAARFFMLRYETEYTPCTGITAVTKQERRHFTDGVMIAPWCPGIKRSGAGSDPLQTGAVLDTGWQFQAGKYPCKVLVSNDQLLPILFLAAEGRFQGKETPYDIPLSDLRLDTLIFGLAVDTLLKQVASPDAFVWGADWECVPALILANERHITSLTLHNTFDECLQQECGEFGATYQIFASSRPANGGVKTALEIGLENVPVITTVNKGFAWGLCHEPIQTEVMAPHLQHLLSKVVGVDNAAFTKVDPGLIALTTQFESDPQTAIETLFERKRAARQKLPWLVRLRARNKVIVVCMGRRVAQKLHDVILTAVREMFAQNRKLPILVIFATIHGDESSPARFKRMKRLQRRFWCKVICEDGRLKYFSALMEAADFNCMPSLYEPHGGAFDGSVVPIARAIDGLAEQICPLNPSPNVIKLSGRYHKPDEKPNGLLFREDTPVSRPKMVADLQELLSASPTADNLVFEKMVSAFKGTLVKAVDLRLQQPEQYASLVFAAVQKQQAWTWEQNFKAMNTLVNTVKPKQK